MTPTQKRYQEMGWPEGRLPPLDDAEAISAAKRLYRKALGRAYKGKWRITTGNRNTWGRGGVFSVNASKGWADMVHLISHYAHARLHPKEPGHGWHHARIEKALIAYVIEQGWLAGKLKRAPKPKADPRDVRYQRTLEGLKRWEAKLKRAETAIRKLNARKRYYERAQKEKAL